MRTIVAGCVAFSGIEFAELALGIDPALFIGVPAETAEQGAARVDAARDVLADLWREDAELAEFAASLLAETAEVVSLPTRGGAAGRWAA